MAFVARQEMRRKTTKINRNRSWWCTRVGCSGCLLGWKTILRSAGLDDMVLILIAGNWHDIVRLSKTTTTAITVLTLLARVIHLLKRRILVQFPVATFGIRFRIFILDTTIGPT